MSHLYAYWNADGLPKIVFDQESFVADPYVNIFWIIPDVIFAGILLKMLYGELRELIPACMNGFDGFLAYLEFWNIVDWLSIFLGFAVICLWLMITLALSGELQDAILQLPNWEALNNWVMDNSTFMTPDEFESVSSHEKTYEVLNLVHSTADGVAGLHGILRLIVFFYNFVLMMKFFKAFRANPRLDIVIHTLLASSTDLIHFFIVFFAIFIVFSYAAHIVFGPSTLRLSDPWRSLMTCWRILMGDVDVDREEFFSTAFNLPLLFDAWLLLFEALVLLVLLNMLLAIIMDTYTAVKTSAMSKEDLTIWKQIREAISTVRETRGHLDLWYLICEFEDDDYPAHPTKTVTSKTLRRAFQRDKMTRHNSDYIIRETQKFVENKEGEIELSASDAVRVTS